MYTLFTRIILSNWRSILVLFLVLIFSGTSFLTLREVTTNVDAFVISKTKPLFGADIRISVRSYASGDIFPMIAPLLVGEQFQVSERREFSTTLFDREGKTGLLQVVAYSGSYPQRGILETDPLREGGSLPRVAATPGLIEKFASGEKLTLDGRLLEITHSIKESSDLGFSLGTENHLLILPSELLLGSSLLSSGSRLDQDLLLSFRDEGRTKIIAEKIKEVLPENIYRVRTFEERTERNLDTVDALTDYITLILLVSSIFAFIILRSAHEGFYESLARTLRVVEILGLTRRREQMLLLWLYGSIFPLSFLVSIGFSYVILTMIRSFPEASDFTFYIATIPEALILLLLLVVMAWFPIWWKLGKDENKGTIKGLKSFIFNYLVLDRLLPFFLGLVVLFLLFSDWKFSLFVGAGAALFFLIFGYLLGLIYRAIFSLSKGLRGGYFPFYDAIRTLVRPLTPTIPITISLVSITVFFLVFVSFSLAFRSKLQIDSTNTANIYAINILEGDKEKIEALKSENSLMYDILRARVIQINGNTLEKHFSTDRVSGEFTREFNITTTPLENRILSGKKVIGKGEVSIDNDFSKRMNLSIGDRVTFLLSGREVTLTVANIRESIREGFRPFFYFSFDPNEFRNAPRTYFLADNAPDTEAWKKSVLAASGPHVTFIDIESVLKIVRDISAKVFSIIGLFFAIVSLFALGAIISFFTRLRPIEEIKHKLYHLFGANKKEIQTSLRGVRMGIFGVSFILSAILGFILSFLILSRSGFFRFSVGDFFFLLSTALILYIILIVSQKK